MGHRRLAAILAFIAVWRQDRMAAWLFAPYAAWLAFASALNGAIFVLK
jgi:tryptophan-rich sensory protein